MPDPATPRRPSATDKLLASADFKEAEAVLQTPGGQALIRLMTFFFDRLEVGRTSQETAANIGGARVVRRVKQWATLREDHAKRLQAIAEAQKQQEGQ